MKTNGNTMLITGGATGIGFALAEKFVGLGNEVIICGRRQAMLDEAKRRLPSVNTTRCDVSNEEDCEALYEWVSANFNGINMLVNNASIRRIDFRNGVDNLLKDNEEIDINLKAPLYLSARFIPLLSKKGEAAIVNVSSGLGFVPLAMFPVYCATKAAIHSFSMSLRHQLKGTSVKVFELVPPTVYDTGLKGAPTEKSARGRCPHLRLLRQR